MKGSDTVLHQKSKRCPLGKPLPAVCRIYVARLGQLAAVVLANVLIFAVLFLWQSSATFPALILSVVLCSLVAVLFERTRLIGVSVASGAAALLVVVLAFSLPGAVFERGLSFANRLKLPEYALEANKFGVFAAIKTLILTQFGPNGLAAAYLISAVLVVVIVSRLMKLGFATLKYLIVPSIILAFVVSFIFPISFTAALLPAVAVSSLVLLFKG